MSTEKDRKTDYVIEEGIRQLRADFRTIPDPDLFDRVNNILYGPGDEQAFTANSNKRANFRLSKPAYKVGWSLTAAAAAIFAGVLVGNLFLSDTYTSEKEAYRQEITMQSDDISGLSADLINYYNEDNP